MIFGPPGVGKGTHSKRLAADVGVPHIATGELFRDEISRGTEFGRQADQFIKRGQLVPDQLVVDALAERLGQPDASDGYLLDGFPRTVPQAEVLGELLRGDGKQLDCVLSLEAAEDVLVARLSGRATCADCQSVYNRVTRVPKRAGVCDVCGGKLILRDDDTEDAVRRRLKEYVAKTTPVLAYFAGQGWPVQTVSSVGDVESVYQRILQAAGGAKS